MINTKPINISITNDLLPRIDEECKKRNVTRSRFFCMVMSDWFNSREALAEFIPKIDKQFEELKSLIKADKEGTISKVIKSVVDDSFGGSEAEARNPEATEKQISYIVSYLDTMSTTGICP